MNLNLLQQKLIAAARIHAPPDDVPYAFEKRILAHLTPPPPVDIWAFWSLALWRAAAPCVALMLVLTVWTALALPRTSEQTASLTDDFERTVLSSLENLEDAW